MAKTKVSIDIKAPIKKVYEVITDFENYPKFISGTKSAKILKKNKNKMEVEFKIDVIKTITYSIAIELDPPNGFTWSLIKGEVMKSNSGGWQLKEIDKKNTKAFYEIEVGFGLLIPSSISKLLMDKNLPQMLKEFKERAE